ncbi:hypothetical protein [Endozoicomonas sp. SCSIO W0465]|uniref:hypothetical protein n=1 Tax=Endozoicomonas sp. SCSIO W0465 TaxID=2918516 RepID=UPI0020762784|nr:hypothetical protein [Endozoicomonas sp. SCSIO W0465]USE38477.1 hypothetical protein MJO57_10090 [Endozoicomonas sp. SCSIO W0465]
MTLPLTTSPNTQLLTPNEASYPGKRTADRSFAGFPVEPVESNELTQRTLEASVCSFCHDLGRDIHQVTVEQNSVLCGSCTQRFTDDPTMSLYGIERLDKPIRLRNTAQMLDEVTIHCPYHTDCDQTLKFGKLREFVEREDRPLTDAESYKQELFTQLDVDYGEERLTGYCEREDLASKPHLKDHLYQCQWRLHRCRYCREVMPRESYLTTHKTQCTKLNTRIDNRTLTAVTCDHCGDSYFGTKGQKMRHKSVCLPEHTPVRLDDILKLPPEKQVALINEYRPLVNYLTERLENMVDFYAETHNNRAEEDHAIERQFDDLDNKVKEQKAIIKKMRSDQNSTRLALVSSETELQSTRLALDSTETRLRVLEACDARHRLICDLRKQPTKLKAIQPGALSDREWLRLEVAKKDDWLKPTRLIEQLENMVYDSSDTIVPRKGCTTITSERDPDVLIFHIADVNALPGQVGDVSVKGNFYDADMHITVRQTDDGKVKLGLSISSNDKFNVGDSVFGQCHFKVFTAHPLYCRKGFMQMSKLPVNPCDSPEPYMVIDEKFAVPQAGLDGSAIARDMLIQLRFTDNQPKGRKALTAPVNKLRKSFRGAAH